MRTEQIFDKWLTYDDDGFVNGIMPEAPDDVKKAYADYIAERKKQAENGYINK
jgi:hypothetical protein